MDKITKKSILKAIAFIGEKSAKIGCNSASVFGYHQPKQPENLKSLLKAEMKK